MFLKDVVLWLLNDLIICFWLLNDLRICYFGCSKVDARQSSFLDVVRIDDEGVKDVVSVENDEDLLVGDRVVPQDFLRVLRK